MNIKEETKTFRRLFPRYREFSRIAECEFFPSVPKKVEVKERPSDFETLLSQIFAVDPITNLPRGDIAQYLSNETNPQIRDYISSQLMSSMEPVGQSSKLSDDELIRYQRQANESVRDYVSRMADYIKDDVLSSRKVVEFKKD